MPTEKDYEICDINLSPAENGFILTYTRRTWKDRDPMTNCSYEYKKEVFATDESEKAFTRMQSLFKQEQEADAAE